MRKNDVERYAENCERSNCQRKERLWAIKLEQSLQEETEDKHEKDDEHHFGSMIPHSSRIGFDLASSVPVFDPLEIGTLLGVWQSLSL